MSFVHVTVLVVLLTLTQQLSQSHPVHHQQHHHHHHHHHQHSAELTTDEKQQPPPSTRDYNVEYDDDDVDDYNTKRTLKEQESFDRILQLLETFYKNYVKSQDDKSGYHQHQAAAVAADYEEDDEMMQGDAPIEDNNNFPNMSGYLENANSSETNSSVHFQALINRMNKVGTNRPRGDLTENIQKQRLKDTSRESALVERTKEQHISKIKATVEKLIIKDSNITSISESLKDSPISFISQLNRILTDTQLTNNENQTDDFNYIEKIRSYHPSCARPINNDEEIWNNDMVMNLYFEFDHLPKDVRVNIASATLRLYQIPQINVTYNAHEENCTNDEDNSSNDKLLHVSIYWYTRSSKKHKVKRRLCDARVVKERAGFVELNVNTAAKAWFKGPGKNLGLAVVVQDQYEKKLRADKYFRGTSCTVGHMRNPADSKPIPNIFRDIVMAGVDNQNSESSGIATSIAQYMLLPAIDVCTIEIPENTTIPLSEETINRIEACKISNLKTDNTKGVNVKSTAVNRHIRHQRQHNSEGIRGGGVKDPRNQMINKFIVMTNKELQNFNATIKDSSTVVNR